MSRYDPYSRRALRALFRQWARANAKFFAAAGIFVVVMLAGTTIGLRLTWPWVATRSYAMGIVHMATVAAAALVIFSAFFAKERMAILHLRGAWGEEFTRDELKRAKRRQIIWGWVDSINLQTGDIDHLVVTRRGGLVGIDSKWRSPDFADHQPMADSASRVKNRSQALAATLLRSERGSHRARTASVVVRPVVVMWGGAQQSIPAGARIDDIEFVAGSNLVSWLATLTDQVIEKEAAKDLIDRLENFRRTAWAGSQPPG